MKKITEDLLLNSVGILFLEKEIDDTKIKKIQNYLKKYEMKLIKENKTEQLKRIRKLYNIILTIKKQHDNNKNDCFYLLKQCQFSFGS